MVKLLKLIGAAHCPWFFLNHNAKIQHSESAIHGFSRLLTDFHGFSLIQFSQVRELIEVQEVITPYGRSGSEETHAKPK